MSSGLLCQSCSCPFTGVHNFTTGAKTCKMFKHYVELSISSVCIARTCKLGCIYDVKWLCWIFQVDWATGRRTRFTLWRLCHIRISFRVNQLINDGRKSRSCLNCSLHVMCATIDGYEAGLMSPEDYMAERAEYGMPPGYGGPMAG